MGHGMDVWGPERLALAVLLRDHVLPSDYGFFIENGTLLGAYRDGAFIPHDDDFDYGVVVRSEADMLSIEDHIRTSLPEPYRVRRISSYADKLEVYHPAYGARLLEGEGYMGADFHYVTVDIQFHLLEGTHCRCLYRKGRELTFPFALVSDLGVATLEGEAFACPGEVEELLKLRYGCLDEGAVYDEETGLYVEA